MKLQKSQTVENLQGEIEFRKMLARQHVTGERLLPGYWDKEEHDKILLERVNSTRHKIYNLTENGITISPFIELGAERCQRSLVLMNDFDADGMAIDISYHQLKTATYFAELFNMPKLPYRVCCDVNLLPFRNKAFPFAFCYEFLHHFPSLKPVLLEIHRVLSDGFFFFDEEPFKQPKIVLYRQKNKTCSKSNSSIALKLIEQYLSEPELAEREYGIIENHDIPLHEWIHSLSIFDEKDVHVSSLSHKIRSAVGTRIAPKNLLNLMLGGDITGLCRKKSDVSNDGTLNLTDLFICPNCAQGSENQAPEQAPLVQKSDTFECSCCDSLFPIIDGIIFLLPTKLFQQLYPELARS